MSNTPATVGATTAQAAATLRTQYRTAVDAAVKALKDSPEQSRDITARAAALRSENARRVAAGVRVNVSPDSFDARHLALQQATTAWHQQHAQAKDALASTVTEILLRALNLLDIAATTMDALETRKAERDLEAARAAAAAAEVKAKKDAEERKERERCKWIEGMRAQAIAEGRIDG